MICLRIPVDGINIEEEDQKMSDYEDQVLKAAYKRAWYQANRGFVNPRDYPELNRAVQAYAIRNHCSYDEAYIFAKTGKKMGRLAD